jgi:hypothetical protein
MTTILGLMQTIKDSLADLEEEIGKLELPYAGFIDTEAVDQVEQERNQDHANDGKI